MYIKKLVRTILFFALCPAWAGEQVVSFAEFSKSNLQGWEPHEFDGKTRYQIVSLDNRTVLMASSEAAASGLVKKQRVDLNKTPFLNWSWRVENTLSPINEKSKKGDDYPARLYIIVSGGLFFWKTKALNYVWASEQKTGSVWPNAYTSNAQMLAVESGGDRAGKWVHEKRNVKADLKKLFGEDIQYIDALALMSDTDNSKKTAISYYGDIFFSTE
ncbi:MAG: DUF3047 domain-containing protein [Gammaproteobacteria bacterium]|nr:DUF3047 domain-containing protein [Gammaproteobacteria bacterium]MDH5692604.1 DUF3047 domain-containing protein [Gammaproteobacteria bacterium]